MREIIGLKATIEGMNLELRAARQSAKRARFLAFHDELTSLPNRRYFTESLGRAFRSKRPAPPSFSIVLIDAQGLDSVADAVGHVIEERVLRVMAARLWNVLRAEDLACHLNGYEFACLLPDLAKRSLMQIAAATLHEAVSGPIRIESLEVFVQVHIGVASAPLHGDKPDLLWEAANKALCLAKQKRVGVCFPDGVNEANALRIVHGAAKEN